MSFYYYLLNNKLIDQNIINDLIIFFYREIYYIGILDEIENEIDDDNN